MIAPPPERSTVEDLDRTRAATLKLADASSDDELRAWPDPEFSPIGWHLGHVAFTEAMWALGRIAGDDSLHTSFARDFAQNGRPKCERSNLPTREWLLGYLARVRNRLHEVSHRLPASFDPLLDRGYLWWFLSSHEQQHRETITAVMAQIGVGRARSSTDAGDRSVTTVSLEALEDEGPPAMVEVPGGTATLGTDAQLAYDNERPARFVQIAPFRLDPHPVTCAAWARFMRAGGYDDRALWSDAGWAWRSRTGARAPFGWVELTPERWAGVRLTTLAPLDGREPVWGVSFHEAEAFARWRRARLPTEAEWEHACRTLDAQQVPERTPAEGLVADRPPPVRPASEGLTGMLGHVWQWTSSWFEPRPGFEAFPYHGYSAPYFGGTHREMRGGSFATSPAIAHPTFRNWYLPHIRQVFAGLRCAD